MISEPTASSINRMLGVLLVAFAVSVAALSASWAFGTRLIGGVRAYVTGEGLWSKGEKDAVFHLASYAERGDETEYRRFLLALEAPLGDRVARRELEKRDPDLVRATDGFLRGGNHPEDVPTLIWIFRHFRRVGFMERAIGIWTRGDEEIDRLLAIASELRARRAAGSLDDAARREFVARIDGINGLLTRLENQFSSTLGAAARTVRRTLQRALTVLSVLLVGGTVGVTWKIARLLRADEEVLRESELRQRVLSNELAARLAELRDADERKNTFLATLSHELRNPLVPLATAVGVLQRNPDDAAARRARDMIERQLDHIVRLVDDLLDITRIARGGLTVHRSRIDLAPLVDQVAADFRAEIEARGLRLVTEIGGGSLWVDGDPVRLSEAIANLLRNAAKFTDPGGEVRVAVEHAGGNARLRVRDSGIGIEPAMLGRVFDPFTRAESGAAASRGGLGLGLAVVRGVVAAHGGSVSAASEGAGRGAEITVSIPLAEAGAPAEVEERRTGAALRRRIVIVEDSSTVAEGMRFFLEHLGHEVSVAADGAAGLARIRAERPDLVLCDIGLPGGMSGYDVARSVRGDPVLAGTRLVAITGYGQETDWMLARDAGFDSHLTKPVSGAVLERVLGDVGVPTSRAAAAGS